VRYVRGRPDIVLVAVVVFFAVTFAFNFQITTLLMATEVYGRGARGFGMLGAITALGSIIGALLAARRPRPRQRLIVLGAIGLGAVVTVSGFMPTYATFAMALPMCGVASLTVMTSANAYIQTSTGPEIRGRVMALYLTVFLGSRPLGAPIIGWLAEHFGARSTLIGGGSVAAVGAAATALVLAPRQGFGMPGPEQWRRVVRGAPVGPPARTRGRSVPARANVSGFARPETSELDRTGGGRAGNGSDGVRDLQTDGRGSTGSLPPGQARRRRAAPRATQPTQRPVDEPVDRHP
jgi:MFS family permease